MRSLFALFNIISWEAIVKKTFDERFKQSDSVSRMKHDWKRDRFGFRIRFSLPVNQYKESQTSEYQVLEFGIIVHKDGYYSNVWNKAFRPTDDVIL